MRALELVHHGLRLGVDLLCGRDAFLDQLGRELLAHGRLLRDPLRHERLRVRGLVLLVVAVPAVADEIDHDVLAEAVAVGERQPDRGDCRLGVVGVHVDDRDVESLRQVARVARRAPLLGIGRESDLVVGDHVQRAAGRVAGEILQVERLGDDPLARERGVAVDEDRERDARVVDARPGAAVGLLGARPPLDDRVDRLEVARIGGERDGDLAGLRRPRALGAMVVLDVSASPLRIGGDRLARPLALELAQDLLVGDADRVGEDVQPAAVRHPDDDLVRAGVGGEVDRLVEHRDEDVEPLDRELLLAEERPVEELLEPFRLDEPLEQLLLLVRRERRAVVARLDRLPEPDALLVVRDVLDLEGHRSAVGLAQVRKDLGERVAGDMDAQDRGRDLLHDVRGEAEALRLEGGIPDGLGAERVEMRGEMAVRPERFDEGRAGGNGGEEGVPWRGGGLGCRDGGGRGCRCDGGLRRAAREPPFSWSCCSRRARPGCVATSSLSPLSKSRRHSSGTASGFSRYWSSRSRA